MIQTKEDKWCVHISTHYILSLLATLICKFNPTPMRNFRIFFVKIDKLIPIFMQKYKTKNSPNFFEKGEEQKWMSYTI